MSKILVENVWSSKMNTSLEKKKIVVVDDEERAVEALLQILHSQADYDATGFSNPVEALKFLQSAQLDLLVTDFVMPEINGAELASRVVAMAGNKDLPVIMLTGVDDDLTISVLKSITSLEFLLKPTRRNEFLETVELQLKRVRTSRAKT